MDHQSFQPAQIPENEAERLQALEELQVLDTQPEPDDGDVLARYRGMHDLWMAAGPVDELVDQVASLLLGEDTEPSFWVTTWRSRPPSAVAEPFEALATRDDLTGRLGQITCPTLVLHGSDDATLHADAAKALVHGLADGSGPVVVDGAGHAPHLSRPDEVNDHLRRFLATAR